MPEAEKASLLGKIKDVATSPYVMGIAPPLFLEWLKKKTGLSG